ncbi:VID27-domain-containing protein [Viridothelium virens]|uniref:VID27-domain-containing protein n=1 Tax=Viridothelium virens TaxID=1048519 RepID=A0A6A6H5T0_VIRVR|nr:VID27-domain-containing protein [Viridothelium virens]
MFMLRNVSKYLFGDTSKETLLDLPQGQLYLVRPLSPKGYSELIFTDAAASIRRTGQDFQYQLVVQRAYEEGEEALNADDDEEALEKELGGDKDEKGFLLDQSLRLRCELREGGETVFAWRDLSGDPGDLFEFVCSPSTSGAETAQFMLVAQQCQYERKYHKSLTAATDQDLREFEFEDEEPIPSASPISSPRTLSPTSTSQSLAAPKSLNLVEAKPGAKRGDMAKKSAEDKASKAVVKKDEKATVAPPSRKAPKSREILAHQTAELHLFDFQSGTFVMQDSEVEATVSEIGDWNYWLQITGEKGDWLGQSIVEDINPVFNFEYLSFIFNHYPEDGAAYSWLLRFKDPSLLENFQEGLMQALWEHLNQTKWFKQKEVERDYILDSFKDLTMDDIREEEAKVEDEEEEEAEEEADEEDEEPAQREEDYDEDEDEDEALERDKDGNVNSQLAVGSKHDRSFVVRGSKIGVFKHTPNNQLEFSTNISKVQTPKGKLFSPKKVMLHEGDRNMVLQNADNPNSLYRMDLEYGKVVDEWKVHDDIPIDVFAPGLQKFAQMTDEKTFLGLSHNALYRVDPRLSGNKLVDAELKQYASKNAFSAAATTEQGYIAVASTKGDVRMFDRLGINAKTHIPALGDPILGLDVSADGRWVLATTRTYLLLIDSLQKSGKNEGKLGFEKSFAADAKPQPRRLALTPSHVAQFQHETDAPISFTPAKFNVDPEAAHTAGGETSIVSATGPFIVTWSLKKILQGRKDPYSIRRYGEQVKADDFRFGTDKNLIVALPNEVEAVKKSMLKRPTRESIAGMATPRRSSGRGTRGSYLGRSDIVNSPY